MKTFKDLKFKPHPLDAKGVISHIYFENGYGASVVKFCSSFGGRDGLYELAVLDNTGNISYDTPITSGVTFGDSSESDNSVLGWLTEEDVTKLLIQIQQI